MQKRGPEILAEDLVIRTYEYGEVKGSITLAESTPLDIVGSSIVKRFQQDPMYFRTELKDGVYIVSEKMQMVAAAAPPLTGSTFADWKNAMQHQYPGHLFSPLNWVEMIPPLILTPIIVPNVVYSHRLDLGRFYYAVPRHYVRVKPNATMLERATSILEGLDVIESVSMVGILGTSPEDCGFSPASFVFKSRVVAQPPPPSFTESAEFTESSPAFDEMMQLSLRIMTIVNDDPNHGPIIEIVQRHQPTFSVDDELEIPGTFSKELLLEIEAYFIKKRNTLKESIIAKYGKRKFTALVKKFKIVDFATITYATYCQLETEVATLRPLATPAAAAAAPIVAVLPKSHEELKALATKTKENTVGALGDLKDELTRMCGKVVQKDHIVLPSQDFGACYRAPTEESIRKEMELSSDSSDSD